MRFASTQMFQYFHLVGNAPMRRSRSEMAQCSRSATSYLKQVTNVSEFEEDRRGWGEKRKGEERKGEVGRRREEDRHCELWRWVKREKGKNTREINISNFKNNNYYTFTYMNSLKKYIYLISAQNQFKKLFSLP